MLPFSYTLQYILKATQGGIWLRVVGRGQRRLCIACVLPAFPLICLNNHRLKSLCILYPCLWMDTGDYCKEKTMLTNYWRSSLSLCLDLRYYILKKITGKHLSLKSSVLMLPFYNGKTNSILVYKSYKWNLLKVLLSLN